jgi:hypothetical protein
MKVNSAFGPNFSIANEAENGRWFFTEVQGDQMFMAGYMYDASGKPVWYESRGAMTSTTTYQGDWYQYANGQTLTGPYKAPTAPTKVGTVRVEFSARDQATLTLSDDLQPAAALSPASMRVNAPSRSRIINIQRPRRVPVLLRPDLWKGTFSYTYTVIPEGVVTSGKLDVNGTVTWVEDEVQDLLGRSINYIILEGQVNTTFSETTTTTTGACPGTSTATGNSTEGLHPSDGNLNLKTDNSYTGGLFFAVTMDLTLVTPCATTTTFRALPIFIDLNGNMTYLNMHGNIPDQGLYPGAVVTKAWNFNAIQ